MPPRERRPPRWTADFLTENPMRETVQPQTGAASVSILRQGMVLMIQLHLHLHRWQSPILCQMGGQAG
jgi:hypothetical protein